MRKDAPGPASGFSLVESMIVVAILAILAGLALPSLQALVLRQRIATTGYTLATELSLARNTAVVRRSPVTLCPSLGNGQCLGTSDWSHGWLIYRDPNRSTQPTSPDDILRETRQPLHASMQAHSTAGRVRIRYQPDGRSGDSNVTLRICSGGMLHGEVVVNNAGRPRNRRLPGTAPCPAP